MADQERVFANREDAGRRLGKFLQKEYKDINALVLGIPRGGVEVAYYVAKMLNGELSTIVTKKLPYPFQEELAFGAASEDGSYYLTPRGQKMEPSDVKKILAEQLVEIKKRVAKYRNDEPLPGMKNRVVMIVDDGIATGATLVPALELCLTKKPSKLIVAAPVGGRHYAREIDELADEVRILVQPEEFYAVGQVYEDFSGVMDLEVIDLLEDFQAHKKVYT